MENKTLIDPYGDCGLIRLMIDPPNGWMYGFPKEIPQYRLKDATKWLVENGYPEHIIKKLGEHFRYRIIEK